MTEETVKISEKGLIKALVIARIAEEKGILPNDYKDILLDGFESLQAYINSDLFWQNDWNQDKCDSLAVMVGIERANLRANEFTKETSEELEIDTPEYNYPQRYKGEDGKDLIDRFEEGLIFEDQTRGFLRGNALKCLVRYKDKNGIDDLIKAREYITRLIAFEDEGDNR